MAALSGYPSYIQAVNQAVRPCRASRLRLAVAVTFALIFLWKCKDLGSLTMKSPQLPGETISKRNFAPEGTPMVIGIGIKKCGTWALQHFLNMHPHFKGKGQPFIGAAYIDSFGYRPKSNNPNDIQDFYGEDMKRLRAIMLVCNPVNRFFSDFVHVMEHRKIKKYPWMFNQMINHDSVSTYVRNSINLFKNNFLPRLGNVSDGINITEYRHLAIRNILDLDPLLKGLFIYPAQEWTTVLPLNNILFINGDDLINAPWSVLREIEKFLKIDAYFSKDLFHFDDEKGFYCLDKCLPKGKGKTRSKGGLKTDIKGLTEEDRKVLAEFYLPYNLKFFELIKRTYEW